MSGVDSAILRPSIHTSAQGFAKTVSLPVPLGTRVAVGTGWTRATWTGVALGRGAGVTETVLTLVVAAASARAVAAASAVAAAPGDVAPIGTDVAEVDAPRPGPDTGTAAGLCRHRPFFERTDRPD